uniref:SGTA homodimerisation domain-containing protein n=1 Tax=Chinchilla lanigera TaxID=34839 RepID=A0A8C2UHH5_CHILA
MSLIKHLVYAVIRLLREQSQMDAYTSDEQESLEVAIQCLETVFKISPEDTHLAVSQPLTEMFTNSFCRNDILPLANLVPEDVGKADQLKDEGNNVMKGENYAAAVDCYTQAIELDPNNAVYYCNRAAARSKLSHYTDVIKDGEKAMTTDSKYSKVYGRMGLALTAVNKFEEAYCSKFNAEPQVQQLMSGMMTNATGGPAVGVGGLADLFSLIQAGQQFAQQIQQNPELIEQLRNHMQSRSFSSSTEEPP